ncbi:MAG: hypothetical protein OSA99_14330 [Acidimicrobiales bacterium]|nr:hypothetical protein [Acidimicrobiales bacterium]
MSEPLRPIVDRRQDRISTPDRLVWNSHDGSHLALRRRRNGRPRPGWRSAPVASGPWSDLRWGWDEDGGEIWERRWWVDRPANFLADVHETRCRLGELDVVVPTVADGDDGIRIERIRWARRSSSPSAAAIRRFIDATLVDALHGGRVIRLGAAHLDRQHRLLVEDVVGIERVEGADQRTLVDVISALARRDAPALDALLHACGSGPGSSSMSTAARRIVGGLEAEWNSTGFVLALRSVASMLIDQSAPGSSTLWSFADELLHRLDVAHRFRTPVFIGPRRVLDLLEGDAYVARSSAP